MNKRVVIYWSIAIGLFAIIGIFGMMNQDLLKTDETDEVYVPIDNSDAVETKICTTQLTGADLSYSFSLNENKDIEVVKINYSANQGSLEAYESANTINGLSIPGVSPNFQGTSENFNLNLLIRMNELDTNGLTGYLDSFNKLFIVVNKITSYDTYKQTIEATTGIQFNCN